MKTKNTSTRAFILALAFSVSLCLCGGKALGQAIPGVATRTANGATLPANAGPYTIFVLTTGTPTIYVCNNNPCMVSGDWVASGGGGGGGGANTALSNLSGVALNTNLQSAPGIAATLAGCNATGSSVGCNAQINGGAGASGGAAGSVYVLGGTGGTASAYSNGGLVTITSGAPGSYSGGGSSGAINISTPNGTATTGALGPSGSILLHTGNSSFGVGGTVELSTGSGPLGYGPVVLTSGTDIVHSGITEPNIQLVASVGNGSPGEIDLDAGASIGIFKVWQGEFWYNTDNYQNFDDPSHRPANAWFGGNVFANSFIAANSVPLAQGTGAFNGQGPYSGAPTSQAGQQTLSFVAGGGLGYSFNGGGAYTVANLTSNISGNSGTTTAFSGTPLQCSGNALSTGIQANGNANCTTANVITLQETTAQASASGYLTIWGSTTTHGPMYSENGGGALPLGGGLTNLFNQDSTASDPTDTLEEIFGTNSETLRIYHSFTSSSNYSRLGLHFDTASSDMVMTTEWGSSGATPGLGFGMGSIPKPFWEISASGQAFQPVNVGGNNQDNLLNIGAATHRIANVYIGTALYLDSTTVGATSLISTASGGMMYAAPSLAGSAGAGLCLDSNVRFTTSGCTGSMTYPSSAGGVTIYAGSNAWGSSIAETNNYVLAGVGGSWTAAAITGAMLPNPSASTLGGVESITSASHNWVSYIDTSGVPHQSQPTLADIAAGVAPAGTFDFTGATPKVPTGAANSGGTNAASQGYVDTTYMSNWSTIGANLSTGTGIPFNTTTGHMTVWGINLREAVTTSQLTFYLVAGDSTGTDTYDIGLFQGTASGTENLLVHTGAVTATSYFTSSGAYVTIPWTATVTLAPGRYYLAMYANENSATATIGQNSSLDIGFYHNASANITPVSSGLPATYSSSADSYTTNQPPYLALH